MHTSREDSAYTEPEHAYVFTSDYASIHIHCASDAAAGTRMKDAYALGKSIPCGSTSEIDSVNSACNR